MKPPRLHNQGFSGSHGLSAGLCLLCSALCAHASDELATSAAPDHPSIVVQLRPAIQVDSEGVFLDQITESRLEQPRLRLCDAPACGKPLLLKRAQLAE